MKRVGYLVVIRVFASTAAHGEYEWRVKGGREERQEVREREKESKREEERVSWINNKNKEEKERVWGDQESIGNRKKKGKREKKRRGKSV